jgi:hypothetical protein
MADTSAHARDGNVMEILSPTLVAGPGSPICDCCRQPRSAEEFDQDCCGICMTCLECDDMLVDVEPEASPRTARERPVP